MTSENRPTGMELKLARVSRRVRQSDLARSMGLSSSRLCNIEAMDSVPPRAADRYLAALSALTAAREGAAS